MCLFLVVGGYRFGTGDHVSQLPTVLHYFDPRLYATDFRLQLIFPWYVKSGLFIALAWLSRLVHMPLEYLFFGFYCMALFFYIASVDELMGLLDIRQEVRNIALLLLLPYSYLFVTISHFHLVTLRLVPYFFVFPLCIKVVNLFIRQRYLLASLLTALVFYIHQQLGLITFGMLFFAILVDKVSKRAAMHDLTATVLPFLSFFLVHAFFMQLRGSYRGYPWFDPVWGRQLLEMVRFRVPHHLLLSYSGWFEKCVFLLVAFLAVAGIRHLRKRKRASQALSNMSVGLLIACAAGVVFTEIFPLPVAFDLYLFRSDVILRVIAFVAFSAAMDRILPVGWVSRPSLVLFTVTAIIGTLVCIYHSNIRIFIPRTEIVSMSECIKKKTPVSAFLLASPAIKGLRLYSERSVFVSWKSHGLFFPPYVAREWFHRMKLLCQMDRGVSCQGSPCKGICGRNFRSIPEPRLLKIARDYNVGYLLVGNSRNLDYEKVCATENYVLYKLR